MLRVGLTGELGSGKSTVARLLATRGAIVFSSDEMGRALMQPGEPVYQAILDHFGPEMALPDGQLNRPALARLAFDPAHPRVAELNALVHPAVLARQADLLDALARTQPDAIAVIESALIFTARDAANDAPWRKRFDYIVVVTAPDALKIDRFVERTRGHSPLSPEREAELRQEALARLALQRIPSDLQSACLLLPNQGTAVELESRVDDLWATLQDLEHDSHA